MGVIYYFICMYSVYSLYIMGVIYYIGALGVLYYRTAILCYYVIYAQFFKLNIHNYKQFFTEGEGMNQTHALCTAILMVHV